MNKKDIILIKKKLFILLIQFLFGNFFIIYLLKKQNYQNFKIKF